MRTRTAYNLFSDWFHNASLELDDSQCSNKTKPIPLWHV